MNWNPSAVAINAFMTDTMRKPIKTIHIALYGASSVVYVKQEAQQMQRQRDM